MAKSISIVSRWNSTVLYEGEHASAKEALVAAVATDGDLSGADLSGANLRDADLSGADLRVANLRVANLRGADLSGADLSGADLSGAYLSGANLRGADLARADLRDANLSDANLSGADLRDADLRDANLSGASLGDADLGGAPVVADLDIRMEEVTRPAGALDMSRWHTCNTTHCRAGWAITLAGAAGAELERKIGSNAAGALIYAASTGGYVPSFFAVDDEARADIVRRAEARRADK